MDIRRPVCVFTLLFVILLAAVMLLTGSGGMEELHQGKYEGRELTVEGTVKNIENKNGRSLIHLKIISPADKELSENILIYLSSEEAIRSQLHIGQTAGISGRLNMFRPAYNRGQFDMREYYYNKRYSYVCYDGHVEYKGKTCNALTDALYRIRLRTEAVYEKYYDERYSGIVKALVLAQRSDLDEEVKEQYKNAGISHILALSGLHIVTMGFILFGMLRKTGLPPGYSAAAAVVPVVLYCIMTGMPTSAVRALIMFLISMAAVLAGRTNDLRTASALAAFIMLLMNPSYLYEAGFQLSFSAVTGIGLIYPSVRAAVLYIFDRDKMRRLHRSDKRSVRMVMALLRSLIFSASLQLAIIPLTMWYYYQLPTYGIIVNLLVIPLAGALLIGCLAAGITGNIVLALNPLTTGDAGGGHTGAGVSGVRFILIRASDGLCRIAALFTSWILKLYDLVTEGVNRLPGGLIVTGRPKLWQMILYYLALVTVVSGGYYLMRRERALKRAALKRRETGHYDRSEGIGAARNRIVMYLRKRSLVLLAMLIAGTVVLFTKIRPKYEISALYVGQGQCYVLHGRDIPAVMYDCGSSDIKEVGKYTVVPFLKYCGISKVDTVFISHLDSDHVSGLIEILDSAPAGLRINRIVISGSASQRESENYPVLLEAAGKYGADIYTMAAGDIIGWKRLVVKCLLPEQPGEAYEYTYGNVYGDAYMQSGDINDDSMVLEIKYPKDGMELTESVSNGDETETFSALFTGDISSSVEDKLLDKELYKYDWLQVAHHGSKTAANERFIETVSPRMAVISAGINNQYGHPHEETLKLFKKLKEQGSTVICVTAWDGETDAEVSGKGIRIRKYNAGNTVKQ